MSRPTSRLRLVVGDITQLDVDIVVTSANEALCGGHGVDGAIHRAAGPGLFEECRTLGICNPGEAKMTLGYCLPTRHVIHTVGPVWEQGQYGEIEVLRSCYRKSLDLASRERAATVAFPCIATGVYEFPKELACEVAVTEVKSWLESHEFPGEVVFCCFEEEDAVLYRERLNSGQEHVTVLP